MSNAKDLPKGQHLTIESLRLDIPSAEAGKLWLLLPDGFRDQASGQVYPLPTTGKDLQRVASIYIPAGTRNCGSLYVKRAIEKRKKNLRNRMSAVLDAEQRKKSVIDMQHDLKKTMRKAREDARAAVDEVREEAIKAVASMTDLFDMGRKGIDRQMKAYLENSSINDEKIDAKAFRECFRMVTQAVKGLGLPSGERDKARDSIIKQAAEAMRSTQSTVQLATANKTTDEEEPVH